MVVSTPKSENALRTIGEVADELNLPQHVLRFWETKFTHISPQKRRGGHRYYKPEDVKQLKEVKTLLYDKGLTIKGAKLFLKEQRDGGSTVRHSDAENSIEHAKLQAVLDELQDIKQLLDNV